MGKINKISVHSHFLRIALLVMSPLLIFADNGIEMADTFRQDGKIYVVVTVMLLIFAGLIAYLFYVDRKVSKLEKSVHAEKM
ncbi:MAG: hypothetical protein JJU02_06655 [Cryomorphaceae bacterium]|nr:hypothetical protein [Cryomorphaceae bacterium]